MVELLRHGRLGDITKATELGLTMRSTRDTLIDLFAWSSVTVTVPSALAVA